MPKFKQPVLIASLCLILAMLNACAITSEEMKAFTSSYRLYERAMRWQNYDLLIGFHKNEQEKLTEAKRKHLQEYRVSAYNVVFTKVEPDERSAIQIVEIKYYHVDYQTLRDLTLTNNWVYDEKTERWQLTNPFPAFH